MKIIKIDDIFSQAIFSSINSLYQFLSGMSLNVQRTLFDLTNLNVTVNATAVGFHCAIALQYSSDIK
jgi:hypothetical protein